jgi:hypothetical protein
MGPKVQVINTMKLYQMASDNNRINHRSLSELELAQTSWVHPGTAAFDFRGKLIESCAQS